MNLPMIRNLLSPLSYLRIRHEQKTFVDWTLPTLLSVLSVVLIYIANRISSINIYKEGELISKILSFTQNLPGFYVAALAAIATFNKISIDQVMPDPAPKIDILIQGRSIPIELTRRRFLCLMFAFLTAESISVILSIIFGQFMYLPIKSITPEILHVYISALYMFFILLMFWQMIITTLWGLFYLGERLHQQDT